MFIIYVLGGPGAGKGTQCAKLAQKYCLHHLSLGDVLRAERNRTDSQYAAIIARNMEQGSIGPMEITVKLLKQAMEEASRQRSESLFLIDGFPRRMDQLLLFEQEVCPAVLALFLNCSEAVRLERLLERGKSGGSVRQDDNASTIKKRFSTFSNTCMTVVEYLRQDGRLVEVEAEKKIEDVCRRAQSKHDD